MRRKITAFLIILCMVLSLSVAYGETKGRDPITINSFDGLTDEEAYVLLLSYGLEVPEVYQQDRESAIMAIGTILDYIRLNNGKCSNPFNYTELSRLTDNVIAVLHPYSGNVPALPGRPILQDSTVIGTWNDSYTNYNCYAYALGRTTGINPGDFSGHTWTNSTTVNTTANYIVDDLDAMGYWSSKSTTKPSSIPYYASLICVRTGGGDYHLMKAQNINSWVHKPGITNPLHWNYSTPSYKVWTTENYFNGTFYSGSPKYNSTIYYITYWAKSGPGPQPYSYEETM